MFFKLCDSKNKYQYLATLSGSFSILTSGINLGWTSPYLPQILEGKIPEIQMTSDEGSWCAVMALCGGPLGAVFCAIFADKIGRKYTTLVLAPVAYFMFIMLAFVRTTFLICLARFMIGAVEGGLFTVLPMYLGEISTPSIRGILSASTAIAMIIGTFTINVLGFYYSIFVSSIICSFVPAIHFFTFMWMPETPYYLIKKGKYEQAKRNLQLLRGDENVEEEMKSLCEAVSRQETVEKGKMFDLFTVKSNRRAVMIFVILNLTKKLSGKNPLMFYTTTIFEAAEGSLSPQVSVMIYILIELIACIASLFIIDRVGRKPIVVVSTIGCALGLASTGVYFFLKDEVSIGMNGFGWLPITALVVFSVSYSMGLQSIPSIYLGELFPTSVKAIALGMADIFNIINGTIAAKLFQIIKDTEGIYLPFWIFSAVCVIGVIFMIKYVPETKNKTLEEIQQYLIRKTASANP